MDDALIQRRDNGSGRGVGACAQSGADQSVQWPHVAQLGLRSDH